MYPIHCRLVCSSSAVHLTQLYTGFGLLAKRGMIQVTFTKDKGYKAGVLAAPKLKVVINDSLRVLYDACDDGRIHESELADYDFYFKRSFRPDTVARLRESAKVHPLGLNYAVYGPGDQGMRRSFWSFQADQTSTKSAFLVQFVRSNGLLSELLSANQSRANCSVEHFESLPRCTAEPRILFFTRVWDPGRISSKPALVEERQAINAMRAACVRLLRKEFGALFQGGIEPTEYARQQFADCLATDQQTRKGNYLRALRQAEITIATMGLEQSNGWKLAEYVAGAKAIVSEKLQYAVPGDFTRGQNYLEFSSPDECVAHVAELVQNPAKRYQMMLRNYGYYHTHLRPDLLIWNTLQTALGHHSSCINQ
jgi:hypothetical protein